MYINLAGKFTAERQLRRHHVLITLCDLSSKLPPRTGHSSGLR